MSSVSMRRLSESRRSQQQSDCQYPKSRDRRRTVQETETDSKKRWGFPGCLHRLYAKDANSFIRKARHKE